MNKGGGGVGIGSASIVLVFAVLCLTVFSLITFIVAGNDKALVAAEAQLVIAYYEADTLAEQIIAEIISAKTIPASVLGIDIETDWDMDADAEVAFFYCPISESKALYVRVDISDETYGILSWKMRDTDEWAYDDTLDLWPGDFLILQGE